MSAGFCGVFSLLAQIQAFEKGVHIVFPFSNELKPSSAETHPEPADTEPPQDWSLTSLMR